MHQRMQFVVDMDVEQPIDPFSAVILIREALAEFVAARGGCNEHPDSEIAEYVSRRYQYKNLTERNAKVAVVKYRCGMAKLLQRIDNQERVVEHGLHESILAWVEGGGNLGDRG